MMIEEEKGHWEDISIYFALLNKHRDKYIETIGPLPGHESSENRRALNFVLGNTIVALLSCGDLDNVINWIREFKQKLTEKNKVLWLNRNELAQ